MALSIFVVGLSTLFSIIFLIWFSIKRKLTIDSVGNFALGIISFWSGFLLLCVLFIVFLKTSGLFSTDLVNENEQAFLIDYGIPLLVGGLMSLAAGLIKVSQVLGFNISKEQ